MKIIKISQIKDIAILRDPNTPTSVLERYIIPPESMFLTPSKIDLILKHPNCTKEMKQQLLQQIEKQKRIQENLRKEEILYQNLQRQQKPIEEKFQQAKLDNILLTKKEKNLGKIEKNKILEKKLLETKIEDPYAKKIQCSLVKNLLKNNIIWNEITIKFVIQTYDQIDTFMNVDNPEGEKIINNFIYLRQNGKYAESYLYLKEISKEILEKTEYINNKN